MKDIRKVKNLVIVSLDDKFSKSVAILLSQKLDMFNLDCKDMVEYDLINPKEVLKKCGLEYLKKRERGVISSCRSYQDTVISIPYLLLKDNIDLFENNFIFYLQLPHEAITHSINEIDFLNRNDWLNEFTDKTISCEKKLKINVVKNIISFIGGEL